MPRQPTPTATRRASLLGLLLALIVGACMAPAPPDAPGVADYFPDAESQKLARAVMADDAAEVAATIADGTLTDVQGAGGMTMLQWAVRNNSHAALLALLDGGADPNQIGLDGDTALHTAALSPRPAHLISLLEYGGDPNVQGAVSGDTPLDDAVLNRNEDPLRILLAAGADPNIVDANGDSPLHTAARVNQGWAILLMLEAGGDPVIINSRGTPWQYFYWNFDPALLNDKARAERRSLIEWLEEHGHEVPPEADGF